MKTIIPFLFGTLLLFPILASSQAMDGRDFDYGSLKDSLYILDYSSNNSLAIPERKPKFYMPNVPNSAPNIGFSTKTPKPSKNEIMDKYKLKLPGQRMENDYKVFNLGDLQTKSKFIHLSFRDHEIIDIDIIKIFVNGKETRDNIKLQGFYYSVNVDLLPGYNQVEIKAITEGFVGPNTAELVVTDEKGKIIAQEIWNLKRGRKARLNIVKI